MPSYTITTYVPEDLTAIVSLLRGALPTEAITEQAFARKVLLDPNFDSRGAFVARNMKGLPVGFLLAIVRSRPLEDAPPDTDIGWFTLGAVAEKVRRQSLADRLLTTGENWLRAQNRKTVVISSYAPNYWWPGVDSNAYPEAFVFLHSRGYTTSHCPLSMDISLVEGLQEPDWLPGRTTKLLASGVQIVPFSTHWILSLTAFLRNEFPGDWQRHLRETMLDIVNDRRAATDILLAVEKERVIGFAHTEGERFGPFGVAKESRGRGVGAWLLFSALRGMRERGLHNAWFLWTDELTATRLYRAAGFRETRRYAVLRKTL